MFFTDYEFMFAFLPLAFIGFRLLAGSGHHKLSLAWVLALSLGFYWSLDKGNIAALLGSIAVNYLVLAGIAKYRVAKPALAQALLGAGVAFNVAFLVYFKYAGLFVDSLSSIAVPLGISFFTLQQIAFLVSASVQNEGPPRKLNYFLFNSFFPYVIAGPLVTRKDVNFDSHGGPSSRALGVVLPGLTMFSFGLFKKVVLADSIAPCVATVFDAVNRGTAITQGDAWVGAVLYTLQIYFDFSGYSDMAVGLALLFGLRLSRNFHSPYKATSIMEFWRRWHMSVTRFFTQYVYMVLAVKCTRLSKSKALTGLVAYVVEVAVPMMTTFLLIGIWHGAGANFVLFGLLMGAALSVNHWWAKRVKVRLPGAVGWLLTMLVVIVGMVLDRSSGMPAAVSLLGTMLRGEATTKSMLVGSTHLLWLVALLVVATCLPNTNEIMGKYPSVIKEAWDDRPTWPSFQWMPNTVGLSACALAFSLSIVFIPRASSFLYYRF